MSSDELKKAVEKINEHVTKLSDPEREPARFVRDIHAQWKTDGGKSGSGKPRHSDRFLEEQLKTQGMRVKSLTPKLVGRTNLTADDAAGLIEYFLSHWPNNAASEADFAYSAMLPKDEIGIVSNAVAASLRDRPFVKVITPPALADANAVEALPGAPMADVIKHHFEECEAIITVAPEEVLLAAAPKTELIGFRMLMDTFRSIESRDRKKRSIIWILDIGGPNMEDEATRQKYLNVQRLITRFKALEHYKDAYSEARMEWLKTRGVIILLDTYGDWGGSVSLRRRPDFSSHHVNITNIHPDWMADSNFRALYGSNLERIRQRIFNVFFNSAANWSRTENNEEVRGGLRYFGYATFENKGEPLGRGLELPALPQRYEEALKAVCVAGSHTLRLKGGAYVHAEEEGENAVNQLSYLGFRVLHVDEFMSMY